MRTLKRPAASACAIAIPSPRSDGAAPKHPHAGGPTYEILCLLGAGGMGEVHRAKDLRLGREVALKVLSSGVISSSERLARFEREARAVARLNHPNIVTLYSVEARWTW